MKRLVVCTDGTWNSADAAKPDGDGLTNVAKVCQVLSSADPHGIRQLCKYHDGVGVHGGWFQKIIGGAFGAGLSANVKDCYRWIVENYEQTDTESDQLFLFGFSRGAYTARSIAGLIRNCGILRREHIDRIDETYDYYRDRNDRTHPDSPESIGRRMKYAYPRDSRITFIGVWDTVGSLGVPTSGPIGWYTRNKYGFHDVQLSSWVDNAFHALAIDEQRKPFAPTLWTLTESQAKDPKYANQRVEQKWFPGVHCNVGGGYPDAKLSNLALAWMLEKATECGLALEPFAIQQIKGDCMGELFDSMTPYYRILGRYVRPVKASQTDPATKQPMVTFEDVAPYAFERRKTHQPPTYKPAYDPVNLKALQG